VKFGCHKEKEGEGIEKSPKGVEKEENNLN